MKHLNLKPLNVGEIDIKKHPKEELTQRKLEYIRGLAKWGDDETIAKNLNITPGAFRTTLTKIFKITDTRTRAQLVYWACKNGLIN